MKTTVDIPDPVLKEAKAYAAETGTTLRALVERGLRSVLERRDRDEEFEMRDGRVDGNGLSDEFRGASWSRLRDHVYQGRGG